MKSSVPVDIQRFLIRVVFFVVVWAKKYCALLIVFIVRESHVDKPNTNTHTHTRAYTCTCTYMYVYILWLTARLFSSTVSPAPKQLRRTLHSRKGARRTGNYVKHKVLKNNSFVYQRNHNNNNNYDYNKELLLRLWFNRHRKWHLPSQSHSYYLHDEMHEITNAINTR